MPESKDYTPLELRFVTDAPELRSASDGSRWITGYAASFGKTSRRLGNFHERVMPTAFDESRSAGWPHVVCRYNHKPEFVLGTTDAGTCIIDVDERGLKYEVNAPKSREDVSELIRRGDVRYSSFAFRCAPEGDTWEETEYGIPMRHLHNVELIDVAPVLDPAYFDTSVSARNMEGVVLSLSRHMNAEPEEVRNMLEEGQINKFFKRTDRASEIRETEVSAVSETTQEETVETEITTDEDRAKLSTKARKALPDSAFAYIDSKGDRHFPIHDKAHVIAALRLGPRSPLWPKVKAKVLAAAKKFGVGTEEQNSILLENEEERSAALSNDLLFTEEERAAAASYADLHKCASCGTENQFGKHCTECGDSMEQKPVNNRKFCPECGGKIVKPRPGAQKRDGEDADDSEDRSSAAPGDVQKNSPDDAKSSGELCDPEHPGNCEDEDGAALTDEDDDTDAIADRGNEEASEGHTMTPTEALLKMAEIRTRMIVSLD